MSSYLLTPLLVAGIVLLALVSKRYSGGLAFALLALIVVAPALFYLST